MTNPRLGAQNDKSTRVRWQHYAVLQVRTRQLAGISRTRGVACVCVYACLGWLPRRGRAISHDLVSAHAARSSGSSSRCRQVAAAAETVGNLTRNSYRYTAYVTGVVRRSVCPSEVLS